MKNPSKDKSINKDRISRHVIRGGGWDDSSGHMRASYSYYGYPIYYDRLIGFRIVRNNNEKSK
jgi:formylglycine-generating enzyme required for sulfatase activity